MKGWAMVLVCVPLATLAVLFLAWLVGCASTPPAQVDPGVYLNQQLDCIAEASTRLQADQCRWRVQVEAGRLHYDVPANHPDATPAPFGVSITFILVDAGGQ